MKSWYTMIREVGCMIGLCLLVHNHYSTARTIEQAEKIPVQREPGYTQDCPNGWTVNKDSFNICNIKNDDKLCTIVFPVKVTTLFQTQFDIRLSLWKNCKRNATFSVVVDRKTAKNVSIPGEPYDGTGIKSVRSKVAVEVNGDEAKLQFSSHGFCGSVDAVLIYVYRCPGTFLS